MADKKYQIFVSSTFRDLAEERQDAIRNVLDLGHIPAGMELFPATDTEQLSYIKKVIDECDYYILITGGRYGSLDEEGVSFTEREYDYAVESGKTVLAFIHGDTSAISIGKSDTAPRLVQALGEFRDRVSKGRLVRFWSTRNELQALVIKALVRAMSDYPAVGWIRANEAASSDQISQVNSLLQENDRLKAKLRILQEAQEIKVIDIAGLDDDLILHYTYTYYYAGRSAGSEQRKGEKSLKWREIFTAVGPSLQGPGTSHTLKTALESHLKQVHEASYSTSIRRDDLAKIEAHLIALRLLKSYTATAVNGGVHAFLQLTDVGKARLIEALAAKKET